MNKEEDKMKYYSKMIFKVIIIFFIIFCLFVAYKVVIFYVPFLIAILVATMIEPIIQFFIKKCKWKRKVSTIISLILVVVIIGGVFTLLISTLISEAKTLIGSLNEPAYHLYTWAEKTVNDLGNGIITIPEDVLNTIQDSMGGIINSLKNITYNVLSAVINTISSIPTMLTYTFITILAIIFVCFDRDYVKDLANKHVPKEWIQKCKEVLHTTCSISWNYIKAEAKLSGICFVLVFIGLLIFDFIGMDVRYTVLMATFIGFVDLLPLFGAGAVMIPWTIYLYFIGNTPLAIGVGVLWCVWAVLKQLIEPRFVSKQMGMHPIFTLLGMYTGFRIFGVIGLMLGPILLLIIKNVFGALIEKGVLKTFFEKE